jgi:hypothetical protein
MRMRFSSRVFCKRPISLSTTLRMTSRDRPENSTQPSSRLRNSGVKVRSMARLACDVSWPPSERPGLKPTDLRDISCAPALVVRISTTLRKSALRPLLSVSVAWSITCSKMLNRSG